MYEIHLNIIQTLTDVHLHIAKIAYGDLLHIWFQIWRLKDPYDMQQALPNSVS